MPKKPAGEFVVDTVIPTLGPAKILSPLSYTHFAEGLMPFFLDAEYLDELKGKDPVPVLFEPAGPREKLYFDSSKTKCAIVTCGGLCPGINDVIRAIVMEAFHNYKVPAVLGIQYGLEGFIPKYGHEVIALTPNLVADIHQFGGTITAKNPKGLFFFTGDGAARPKSVTLPARPYLGISSEDEEATLDVIEGAIKRASA